MPAELVDLLKARKKNAPHPRWIFVNEDGRPDNHFLRKLKRIAHRAGLNCGHCKTTVTKGKYETKREVEVTCATDPSAKNSTFIGFARRVRLAGSNTAYPFARFNSCSATKAWRRRRNTSGSATSRGCLLSSIQPSATDPRSSQSFFSSRTLYTQYSSHLCLHGARAAPIIFSTPFFLSFRLIFRRTLRRAAFAFVVVGNKSATTVLVFALLHAPRRASSKIANCLVKSVLPGKRSNIRILRPVNARTARNHDLQQTLRIEYR